MVVKADAKAGSALIFNGVGIKPDAGKSFANVALSGDDGASIKAEKMADANGSCSGTGAPTDPINGVCDTVVSISICAIIASNGRVTNAIQQLACLNRIKSSRRNKFIR